jgi:hypothetical protein
MDGKIKMINIEKLRRDMELRKKFDNEEECELFIARIDTPQERVLKIKRDILSIVIDKYKEEIYGGNLDAKKKIIELIRDSIIYKIINYGKYLENNILVENKNEMLILDDMFKKYLDKI